MKASEIIKNTPPAELARITGRRQNHSTRDKQLLLKKALEVEEVIRKLSEK